MRKQLVNTLALSAAALVACSTTTTQAQTLTHRYSFNDATGSTSFADSIGGITWNGSLVGSAALDGSQLQLDGFGSFGTMPGGMISGYQQVSIEFWATFSSANPEWTRVFSFGSQNESGAKFQGLDYCHYAGGNWQNLDCSGTNGGAYANNPGGLNGQTNVHVTIVVDPVNNQMFYYNGTRIASNPGLNGGPLPSLNNINDSLSLIGKSLFDADQTLIGSIDEFRVYSGIVTSQRIAVNEAAGPNNYVTDAGSLQAVHLTSPETTLTVNQVSKQSFTGDFANVSGVDLVLYGGATFTSGNTSVLTVDTNGNVRAMAPGSTTLVASFGGKSATNSFTVIAVPAVLKHRYSFTTDVTDSISGANGTLQGGATISGGKAVLDGVYGSYVDLPGPAISLSTNKSVTIEAWVTFGDVPTWSRLWDFGHEDATSEIYLAPRVHNGGRHWISQNIGGGRTFDWQGTLSNQTAQITAVIDPPTGTLAIYKNGVLEHAVYNATAPLSLVSNTMAVIGRSLVAADQYMPGSIDEFRIYNGALSPEEIALTYQNGVSSIVRDPGTLQSIQVAPIVYPADSGRMAPKILANYANLQNFDLMPNVSAVVNGLTLTSSDTNVVMVLENNLIRTLTPGQATLTATYRGKTSTQTVNVASSTSHLTHRYSFSGNYNDSVGTAHGTPMNTASVADGKLVLDGQPGTYLELPGGMLKGYDAVTIDTWVNFNAGSAWRRLWYFGSDRENEFYVAPIVLDGQQHRFSTGFATVGGGNMDIPGRWENMPMHVTAVYGNGTMALYTNGVLERSIVVNGRIDQIGEWYSWIGKSPYTADAYMECAVDEFRIYNGRLSPQEIQASHLLGPETLLTDTVPVLAATLSAGNVTLKWPAAAASSIIQASGTLASGSWAPVTNAPVLVGNEWQLTVPASGDSKFFRLWNP